MKRCLIVSAHFTPSNLAGVMRARFLSTRLSETGWQPVVVTVAPEGYEEPNDDAARALLPDGLRVERVQAWPAEICRPLGFGDVSLRAQFALRRRVREIIRREKVDLIFCTVLPGYTSLVGAWAKRTFGIPFVLDYQDPWVTDAGAQQPRLTKAGLAHWLALQCEPRVLPQVDALTSVSDESLETLRHRRLIPPGTPIEIVPIGAEERDHAVAATAGRSAVQKEPGVADLVYVGTLTERMLPALRTLLAAVKTLTDSGRQLRVHLIGTSAQPQGTDSVRAGRIIRETGTEACVRLSPGRIPYLDALRTMQDADVLLLLGSTDSHYTASKIFPCWLAQKPILGVFHAGSTVTSLATQLGGVALVTYDQFNGPETCVAETALKIEQLFLARDGAMPPRQPAAFAPYSASGVAKTFAGLFDRVLAGKAGN